MFRLSHLVWLARDSCLVLICCESKVLLAGWDRWLVLIRCEKKILSLAMVEKPNKQV